MLQLAEFSGPQDYQDALASGELRHPVLSSLRVRLKREAKTDVELADTTEHTQPATRNKGCDTAWNPGPASDAFQFLFQTLGIGPSGYR